MESRLLLPSSRVSRPLPLSSRESGSPTPRRLPLPVFPFPTLMASSPLLPLPPLPPSSLTSPTPPPLLPPPPPGRPSSPPSSSTPGTPSSTVWTKLCLQRLYLRFPIHPASQTVLVPDLLTTPSHFPLSKKVVAAHMS